MKGMINRMNNIKDLTGMIFNKWTVINRAEDKISGKAKVIKRYWHCRCECGTERDVCEYTLTHFTSKNCGCRRGDSIRGTNRKYNRYEEKEDYFIFYTSKDEPFVVDKCDFEKVHKVCWCKNNSGYLTGCNAEEGGTLLLQRYLLDCPNNMVVDHKDGDRANNRRSNLRICTNSENRINKGIISTNTSGHTGIYWNKSRRKWIAQIGYGINEKTSKKKCIYLGSYDDIKDAIQAREDAEKKYYGEFSYTATQEDLNNE